jgi:hypothetical protein
LRVLVVLVVPAIPPPSPQSRASTAPIARRSPPRGSSSSDWPLAKRRLARLAAIPRSPAIGPVVQRRCTASRRRRHPPLERKPLPPQSTPPTADSVESTMPRSSETFMRSAQTGAIARAARRTAWWNLMLSSNYWSAGLGQPRD